MRPSEGLTRHTTFDVVLLPGETTRLRIVAISDIAETEAPTNGNSAETEAPAPLRRHCSVSAMLSNGTQRDMRYMIYGLDPVDASRPSAPKPLNPLVLRREPEVWALIVYAGEGAPALRAAPSP